MTITGVSNLGSSSLSSPAPSGAGGRYSLQAVSPNPAGELGTSPDGGTSAFINLSPADFSSAANVLQTLPPGTVQYGYTSGATTTSTSLTSATASSSTSESSTQNSIESGSYDISYNTSLQTLQSLGLIQPGDTLTSSSVQMMTQQAQQTQQSTTQSASISQPTDTSIDGTQSSITSTTQQSVSEQNAALLVTQNWTTPNGVGFVFQEMVRVNQNTQTEEIGGSMSNTSSPDAIANLANAIAEALPSPLQGIENVSPLSNQPGSTSSASYQPGSTGVFKSSTLSGSGIDGSGISSTDAYLVNATLSDSGDNAMAKQTDSLLALLSACSVSF